MVSWKCGDPISFHLNVFPKRYYNPDFIGAFPNKIKSIYNKSASTLFENTDIEDSDGLLYGQLGEVLVHENGIPFYVDIENGQKTGFLSIKEIIERLLVNSLKVKTC